VWWIKQDLRSVWSQLDSGEIKRK
jgi:hypothetical protein